MRQIKIKKLKVTKEITIFFLKVCEIWKNSLFFRNWLKFRETVSEEALRELRFERWIALVRTVKRRSSCRLYCTMGTVQHSTLYILKVDQGKEIHVPIIFNPESDPRKYQLFFPSLFKNQKYKASNDSFCYLGRAW